MLNLQLLLSLLEYFLDYVVFLVINDALGKPKFTLIISFIITYLILLPNCSLGSFLSLKTIRYTRLGLYVDYFG